MSLSQLLQKRVSVLVERQQRLALWCRLASCWAGFCFVAVGLFLRDRVPAPWRDLARQIELVHPDLDGRLLTAVQQQAGAGSELNFLQQRLLLETLRHSHNHDWAEAIPRHRLRLAQLAHWLALGLFARIT